MCALPFFIHLRFWSEQEDIEAAKKNPVPFSALCSIPNDNDYLAKNSKFNFNTYYNQEEVHFSVSICFPSSYILCVG